MPDRSDEILATLKKIEAWTDLQRKIIRWSLWSTLPFVLVMIAFPFLASRYLNQTLKSHSEAASKEYDWYDVSHASRKGDLHKALSMADELLSRHPRDFNGHYQRGEILLMLDERPEALKSFRKAAEIFPLPKYQSAVKALEPAPPDGES
ncbi:MAG TPA: hypothetical protein VNQ90_11285 [Chthoniobacteraceae bacterium]|nr:hypothetical protein [Chthoniobacteraceae bacterium]